MTQTIEKGMILAAGLGTRLLPITQKVPKPLVPVLNVPNILYSVALLKRAGIRDIIINVHHLQDQLVAALGNGSQWGVRLSFSREAVLLGTGGGVKKAEPFFGKNHFLLTNSDFITDVNLNPFIERHFERKSLATMVLFKDPMMAGFYSQVGADPQFRLCSLPSLQTAPPTHTGIFSGIHFLAPETLKYLQAVPSGINQILYPQAMRETPDRVFCDFMEGSFWFDTGDLYFLWLTSMRLLERLLVENPDVVNLLRETGGYESPKPGIWVARGERLPANCRIEGPAVIGSGVQVGSGCSLGPFVVIGDRCRVAAGSRLSRFVALPDSDVSPSQPLEGGLQFEGAVLPTKNAG